MHKHNFLLSHALTMLAGELILSFFTAIFFGFLGFRGRSVLLGCAAGALIATVNHILLILGVSAASNKAGKQDAKGGQAIILLSYMSRMAALSLVLVLCARSGLFFLPALVIPLLLTRPILTLADHINNRKGGSKA